MTDPIRGKKPMTAEIKATLSKATQSAGGPSLNEKDAAALTDFIERLGVERARQAIESLEKIKAA
ncbi:MAG TPA: hypothetical protein VMV69_03950 [Pirellulales bacterium]|nr:hypothetical protein [Pirellulales bacterium]